MALLLLSACTTAPTKVVAPLPPTQSTLVTDSLAPQQPTSILDEIQSSALPVAETSTTMTPIAVAEDLIIVSAIDPTPINVMAQPEYYQSFASYYAKRFAGRRTSIGERYDPNRMTAATRDFPLRSWLRVINPANGKEVTVRINDRTGKRKTPLIDLSRAAAKELGFLGKGKIRVHVIPLLPSL